MTEPTQIPLQDVAPPSRSRALRGAITAVLILVLGVVSMRTLVRMRKKPQRKKPQALSLRVQTQTILRKDRWLYLDGFGTTQADQSLELVPEVNGKIVYTLRDLKPGRAVKRRQLLLRIDSRTYRLEYDRLKKQRDSLKKQMKLAEEALKLDQRDEARNRRLLKRRAIDPGTYDRVQLRVLERVRALESLRQNYEITDIQLQQASINVSRTGLYSPFDARITQGTLNYGTFVAAGRSVLTLESTEAVEIPVAFSLEDLRKIRDEQGQEISIDKIPAYLRKLGPVEVHLPQSTGEAWKGIVQRIGGRLDLRTRTIDLWVRIPLRNSTSKKSEVINKKILLPGVFCQVRLPIRKIPHAVRVPRQAIYDGSYVYMVVTDDKGQKRLRRRKVEIAHTSNEYVLVQDGVKDQESLVISPLSDPVEGTPVFSTPHNDKTHHAG
ncbi:MAG: efflux RND transporter periplasmic adaptor subunit [Myxococcales bacterium]|nr:efflux RND transporter periplasmic adaptor subunit [Myxococcales bacterium]